MIPLPPLPDKWDAQSEFPILARWVFFNHAAVAPLPARAAAALADYGRLSSQDAYLTARWHQRAERVRKMAAELIHASPDEIAFVKNTSEGLAFVANGLAWRPGDEIVSTAVEYPANVYPWMDLAQRFGVKHIMVPERTADGTGRIETADLLAAVTPRTKLLAISHVEYASGFRNDLATLGRFCRERGILLCVDAIQSCGVLPVDVQAMHIDFLSADGHKWLLGPEGAGIFYCRRELIPQVHPEIGWLNMAHAMDFDHFDLTLRTDARRFECGAWNLPGILALGAALQLLQEVGLDTVWPRVFALTEHLCAGLAAKGYQVFSSRRGGPTGESSGIVSFRSPRHDSAELVKDLERQKIILALRANRLRASPHFYNSLDQVDQLLDALPSV